MKRIKVAPIMEEHVVGQKVVSGPVIAVSASGVKGYVNQRANAASSVQDARNKKVKSFTSRQSQITGHLGGPAFLRRQTYSAISLPEAQTRHDKCFTKARAEQRQKSLLPSYKRILLTLSKSLYRGHYVGCCASLRYKRKLCSHRLGIRLTELGQILELWRGSFKTIEGLYDVAKDTGGTTHLLLTFKMLYTCRCGSQFGRYGSGVTSYFRFLKSLFLLNIWLTLLTVVFVVVPAHIFEPDFFIDQQYSNRSFEMVNQSEYCSLMYDYSVELKEGQNVAVDALQGTGWLERTLMFYGHYLDVDLLIGTWDDQPYWYKLPLAYLLVILASFLISLSFLVWQTATGFRNASDKTVIDHNNRFCSLVFASWDFMLVQPKTADLKKISLYTRIKCELQEDRDYIRRHSRRFLMRCGIVIARILINILVIACLGGSGYVIYMATAFSLQNLERPDYDDQHPFMQLLFSFLPSLAITALNTVVPVIFKKLVAGEDLSTENEIKATLARTVFLRLASLGVLFGTLYGQVTCPVKDDDCHVGVQPSCPALRCWETYVGQQMYKLVVMDFIVSISMVFVLDWPRRALVTRCSCKLAKMIGRPEFEIPKNVLHLMYSQTLCWLGMFFSPMIPSICLLKLFLLFYAKKFTCVHNCVPPTRLFSASSSHTFFAAVLLLAFTFCCVPVAYVIWSVKPSVGCGPFRVLRVTFDAVFVTLKSFPDIVGDVLNAMASPWVVVPALIVLCIALYYMHVITKKGKTTLKLLQEELITETKDKHHLMFNSESQ